MGKDFEPPILEETSPVKPEELKIKSSLSPVNSGVVKVTSSNAVVDAYKKELDVFDSFVLDKNSELLSKKERQQIIIGTIRTFQNILKLDLSQASQCLDHFLRNVGKSQRRYNSGEIVSPLFTLGKKDIPYDCKIDRFIDLIIFLVDLQGSYSKGGSSKFIGRYRDLAYNFKDWTPQQRNLLIDYVTSKAS